ncbi:MAG: chromosomal replication initiator protein DnaA [Desulfomonile sp.]|nr:chromosomal replication initiator protein DnaA [Desulfomonile sp.]
MPTLWERCLELLQTRVNEDIMSTWIDPIMCEEVTQDRILLSAPNNFFVSWIHDNYKKLISNVIIELTGITYQIEFRSRNDLNPAALDIDVCKDPPPVVPEHLTITDEFALSHNLNPRYTFESFVVGSYNQFASAAAMSVAEKPASNYNPLFIYGGVGLGKTHLMSAIGYEVLSRNKGRKVSFTTSEEFTNEMINAIRFERMADFRDKYRNVDLLLIDDIQFLARKERTQEEFFHTFNRIYDNGKQIVITADCTPNELSDIEQRLTSRFGLGLVADLGVPDLETRVAILRRKAYEDCLGLPDDVAYFLAEQVESNVRDLVGHLVRVVAMSKLQGLPLTRDLAEMALKDVMRRQTKPVTVDLIIGHVSKAFNVKVSDLKSKKKHKLYAFPRQVAMYLARELTECSYPEIGEAFGGKDHSTVIYAARKIEKAQEKDHSLKNMIEGIRKEIKR